MDYRDIITIESGRRGGKPTIRGMRITVQAALDYLAGGMSEAEILADFPELSPEDIRACLALAAAGTDPGRTDEDGGAARH
ncbi:MAG TPA: DUF433 domain-containing protein [Thermomicrobiales bacterium]|nr:DUF433 domain-containing protein [Thermomicrobiales bacterium]